MAASLSHVTFPALVLCNQNQVKSVQSGRMSDLQAKSALADIFYESCVNVNVVDIGRGFIFTSFQSWK